MSQLHRRRQMRQLLSTKPPEGQVGYILDRNDDGETKIQAHPIKQRLASLLDILFVGHAGLVEGSRHGATKAVAGEPGNFQTSCIVRKDEPNDLPVWQLRVPAQTEADFLVVSDEDC